MIPFDAVFVGTGNTFTAIFEEQQEFDANFSDAFIIEKVVGDVYTGPYTVTPRPYEEQVLETKQKVMDRDLHVKEIPYYETTNIQNGYTVYIGSEV